MCPEWCIRTKDLSLQVSINWVCNNCKLETPSDSKLPTLLEWHSTPEALRECGMLAVNGLESLSLIKWINQINVNH